MVNTLSFLPIPLLQWYGEHARDLPWRREPTPYRVWVSEIMLQQTRVAAVLGYFAKFMDAFPTVQDLAAAPEDQLMKLWQGLGYYSRARNLQKAARQIVDTFGGVFPTDYGDIRSLAGVGDYTAAAIASISFGQPVPVVDGNLLRVAARVMGDDTDITTTQGKRHFTAALQEIIPLDFPGQFNQAMMDLGAHPMYTLHWFLGEPKSIVSQFTEVTHRGVEDNAVSVLEFEGGAIGVSETGFVTSGNGYFLELSGTQGSLHVFGDHGDRLEYSCPETGGKTVEMTDLPQPDTMPIDAWIAACCGQGQAPNGIDEAVALTQFMVGAYESYRTGQKYTFPSAN